MVSLTVSLTVRATLLCLLCAIVVTPAQSADPKVSFVSPRHLSTVVGTATIELDLRVPKGQQVDRIEMLADGKRIGIGLPARVDPVSRWS